MARTTWWSVTGRLPAPRSTATRYGWSASPVRTSCRRKGPKRSLGFWSRSWRLALLLRQLELEPDGLLAGGHTVEAVADGVDAQRSLEAPLEPLSEGGLEQLAAL